MLALFFFILGSWMGYCVGCQLTNHQWTKFMNDTMKNLKD